MTDAYAIYGPHFGIVDYSHRQFIARQVIGPPPGFEPVEHVEVSDESEESGRPSKSSDNDYSNSSDSSSVAATWMDKVDDNIKNTKY